jgi:hypothetical protein
MIVLYVEKVSDESDEIVYTVTVSILTETADVGTVLGIEVGKLGCERTVGTAVIVIVVSIISEIGTNVEIELTVTSVTEAGMNEGALVGNFGDELELYGTDDN